MRYDQWLIDKLRNHEEMKQSLILIPEQIKTLELKMETLKAAATDKVIVSGGTDHSEDERIANIHERDVLTRNLEIARREVETMEKALSELTDDERTVIDGFFINRRNGYLCALCDELNCEVSNVYKLKNKAMVSLARRLLGIVEL